MMYLQHEYFKISRISLNNQYSGGFATKFSLKAMSLWRMPI